MSRSHAFSRAPALARVACIHIELPFTMSLIGYSEYFGFCFTIIWVENRITTFLFQITLLKPTYGSPIFSPQPPSLMNSPLHNRLWFTIPYIYQTTTGANIRRHNIDLDCVDIWNQSTVRLGSTPYCKIWKIKWNTTTLDVDVVVKTHHVIRQLIRNKRKSEKITFCNI